MTHKQITKIVITGGPCSGKSTSMSYLAQKLDELGYGVITIPEFATKIILSGCTPGKNIDVYDFEEALLLGQLNMEKIYEDLANKLHSEKVVMLLDRGTLDIKAYMSNTEWGSLLHDLNMHEIKLRDERYNAVIHLRTAALGAEPFYTQANNEARLETPQDAAVKCELTLNAWIGHPHLHIIDNSTGFEMKLKRTLKAILHTLGEPTPLEIERKYLVDPNFDPKDIPCTFIATEIEQAYLRNGFRVRKRGREGVYLYTKTHKQATDTPLIRIEKEELISAREYELLLHDKCPDIPKLFKTRICFVHNEQHFELDVFKDKKLIMLEIELTESHSSVSLPQWLPIVQEVTNNPRFKNDAIARDSHLITP